MSYTIIRNFLQTYSFSKRLERAWYAPFSLLSLVLLPFSILYAWLVRFLADYKRPRSSPFSVPIVIVGNLTVGGTGKSPTVMALASTLQALGYQPGMVSRGYGGNTQQVRAVSSLSEATEVGDEALMLAQALSGLAIFVGQDRNAAVRALLKANPRCDVVISDDGLQHYRLWRDISICLYDEKRKWGNRHCLPAGPLREPLSALSRMDFVETVTGEKGILVLKSEQWVNVRDPNRHLPVDAFKEKTVMAIAGIAHPERFFQTLAKLKIRYFPCPFPDHHSYTEKDFSLMHDKLIVMTEKDAVKCRTFVGEEAWYLQRRFGLLPEFEEKLVKKLAEKRK